MKLTQKILKELLYYDQNTGIFIWRKRNIKWFSQCKNPDMTCSMWNGRYSHTKSGYISDGSNRCSTDYIIIKVFGAAYKAHILAWLYVHNEMPNKIDHKDHNGLNNKISNLRSVTCLENSHNRKISSNNKSGYNGVYFSKREGKWKASITFMGKNIHGGTFLNILDAIKKRKQMSVEYGFHENHGKSI